MKVQAEISYILENEPIIFVSTEEIYSRSVYVWEDKRAYLSPLEPWTTFIRNSMNETLGSSNGIMEIWSIDSADPTNNMDDMWIEYYKCIDMKTHTIEWHNESKMLRLIWLQNFETIQQKKLLTSIMKSLEQFKLEFPGFPNSIHS